MPSITYDDTSFAVDGKRIWLVSGSIHYFRIPSSLWPDRLLKAKRAGLNCIDTYIAWNFHESREGKWELKGDQDVEEFVRLAEELGLYVILRPGPYICADWDFGGLPAWLTTKTGIAYRTSNAAYTHYFDKYFRQVLRRLAELQVTRGGNIILIQNENEYFMTALPDRTSYLEFINQLFRRSGFDIPIITCNCLSDPPLAETIECVNAWGDGVQQLKRLRIRQPRAPLMVTEYRLGDCDRWGQPHRTKDARETARRALEILGCGAQYNYYMFHGGTNFAFWGSRLADSSDSYETTSYDYDAPLAEGGGLTPKYYLTRLVNMLANHMGQFLAAATMGEPGVTVDDSTCILNLTSPLGRWAFVTNNGRNDITSARISLPSGKELTLWLGLLGATAVPVSLRLAPTTVLDYCNLMPLGFYDQNILILHGPAGWEGVFSVNGLERRVSVPAGEERKVVDCDGLTVVLINSELAMRTWLVGDSLVFGPSYVGETAEDVVMPPNLKQYEVMGPDRQVTEKKVLAAGAEARAPAAPRLGNWVRTGVCTEPAAKGLEWQKIDRPRDVDHLGAHYGYAWYRVEVEEDRPRRRNLFLSDCEDRATIFLNGDLVGTWGRGDAAVREPIPANFRKGINVLTVLADNLGRLNFGPRLGELKGLYGHIHDAKPLGVKKVKFKTQQEFTRRIVPRHLSYLMGELEKGPIHEAEIAIVLPTVTPIHVSFTDLPHHLAVFCNERMAGFFPRLGSNYGDVTLGPELRKGKNVVKFLLWGDATPKTLDNVRFYLLTECITGNTSWGYRPWTKPQPGGMIVGKDQPAWYATSFTCTELKHPLFLHIIGARKGQVFLNGLNVGRFWTVGPQQYYYLPECWLKEENELLLFEEHGRIPANSTLVVRPLGPYHD